MTTIENIIKDRLDAFASIAGCGYFILDENRSLHLGTGLKYSEIELLQMNLDEVWRCFDEYLTGRRN